MLCTSASLYTCLSLVTWLPNLSLGALRPQDSESRLTKSLDGIWRFKVANAMDPDQGFREQWFKSDLKEATIMPVPASYNDIGTSAQLRDHVGWVWYQRSFFVPKQCQDMKVFIRFGSVHYTAHVYVDDVMLTTHTGGHLPFEAELPSWSAMSSHLLTVAVNNTLTRSTVPQGEIKWRQECEKIECSNSSKFYLDYHFDFFNYAGIHRSVELHCLPKNHLENIRISTAINQDLTKASIYLELGFLLKDLGEGSVELELRDREDNKIDNSLLKLNNKRFDYNIIYEDKVKTEIVVKKPKLWWPYLTKNQDVFGYLYTLKISLIDSQTKEVIDVYRQKLGLRSLSWSNSSLLLNNQPLYLHGFGKHEDSDIRGKGFDSPTLVRDFELIKWLNANALRTSHYPYDEHLLDLADSTGILVIDECPAVALDHFTSDLRINHQKSIKEMINRDINRPSVIAWSIANEPRSTHEQAEEYFKNIVNYTRGLDYTRPIMVVINAPFNEDRASLDVDIIGINRYLGWYSQSGHTELIQDMLARDVQNWKKRFREKLIVVTEYGAGSLNEFHSLPSRMFTSEYQVELMQQTFRAFDQLRAENFIIGELIWNFADFMTKQEIQRVNGNRKGVFTRQREPKMAAHLLRSRFATLVGKQDYNETNNRCSVDSFGFGL